MKKFLPILKKCSLFNGITDEEILQILTCLNPKIINRKKGEYILCAGSSTDCIGLISEGSALIVQDDLWGNRNVMAKIPTAALYGEPFAVMPEIPLNISVVAMENCQIILFPAKKLFNICSDACSYHNLLVQNLITELAQKILMLNDKITHISKRKTRDKLLSYLSAESLRQKSLNFHIPYDRQQLADFLCVERAAMSVELSRLQKEGYLKTKQSYFELYINEENI